MATENHAEPLDGERIRTFKQRVAQLYPHIAPALRNDTALTETEWETIVTTLAGPQPDKGKGALERLTNAQLDGLIAHADDLLRTQGLAVAVPATMQPAAPPPPPLPTPEQFAAARAQLAESQGQVEVLIAAPVATVTPLLLRVPNVTPRQTAPRTIEDELRRTAHVTFPETGDATPPEAEAPPPAAQPAPEPAAPASAPAPDNLSLSAADMSTIFANLNDDRIARAIDALGNGDGQLDVAEMYTLQALAATDPAQIRRIAATLEQSGVAAGEPQQNAALEPSYTPIHPDLAGPERSRG